MWHVFSELFIICLIYYSTVASESHTDSDSEWEREVQAVLHDRMRVMYANISYT